MKIEITGPIKRTKPFEVDKEDEDIKIVVPGSIISNRTDFMSGHGTFYGNEDIVASVAGSVRQVNKLLTVQPFKSRYSPDVGDVIVGRVVEVQQKRWKVDINSVSEGILALANVSLPGGELRRKSAEDEMRMRMYMEEGDLVVAEVLNVTSEAIQLQARTLRYGKLGQGLLVKVSPSLMKRRKTHFHDLHFGAKIILARNGWVWIEPPSDGQMSATGGYTHSDEVNITFYLKITIKKKQANTDKILNNLFSKKDKILLKNVFHFSNAANLRDPFRYFVIKNVVI
uniref:Ribosomal RNA-processing protein 4 n=1 Tax=Panagrolaimus sp. PS1159 TaxID=55785 RepID=A0AC35FI15_9BILA